MCETNSIYICVEVIIGEFALKVVEFRCGRFVVTPDLHVTSCSLSEYSTFTEMQSELMAWDGRLECYVLCSWHHNCPIALKTVGS